MKFSKQQIFVFVIIAGIILIIVLAMRYMKRSRTAKRVASGDPVTSLASSLGVCKYNSDTFPLKKCESGGAKTKEFQTAFNAIAVMYEGVPLLKIDGKFGPNTEKAVQALFGTSTLSEKQLQEAKTNSLNPFIVSSLYDAKITAAYGAKVKFAGFGGLYFDDINTSTDNDFYNPNLYGNVNDYSTTGSVSR